MEAQVQVDPAVAPQKPVLLARSDQVPPPKGSADSFVDAAMDFLAEEPAAKPSRRKPQPDVPPEDNHEPAEDDQVEGGPGDEEREPGDDAEEDGFEGEEGEPGEEDVHDTRGSKKEPFSVKDLPADKFIEVKIDGEKLTIPLSELAHGYIREQTFNRRLNKTTELAQQAQQAVAQAAEVPKRVAREFQTFVRDPDELFTFFTATDDREQVLEAVARRYAELRRNHRENPEQGLAWKRQRDQQRIAYEREQFETQKRQEQQQRQQREAYAQAQAIFNPGWAKGLAKAGSPTPTKELWNEVLLRCQQKQATGEPVTSEDVATYTARACKLLELKPATAQKPKPAPVAPPKERSAAQGRGKDWNAVPRRERAKSPDFFLRSLRAKDFR